MKLFTFALLTPLYSQTPMLMVSFPPAFKPPRMKLTYVNSAWPSGGEIDIIEGANDRGTVSALHTGWECWMNNTAMHQTGYVVPRRSLQRALSTA